MALGFVIPVSVVSNQKAEADMPLIGVDLFNMFLGVAIITSVLLIAIAAGKLLFLPTLANFFSSFQCF